MIQHAQVTWKVLTAPRSHYISLRPYVHTGSGTQEVSCPKTVWGSFPETKAVGVCTLAPHSQLPPKFKKWWIHTTLINI